MSALSQQSGGEKKLDLGEPGEAVREENELPFSS